MKPVLIRQLVIYDADDYRGVALQGYKDEPEAFTSEFEERSASPHSYWQDRVNPNNSGHELVFGAFLDNKLVGVAGLSFDQRQKAKHKANVFGVYVVPEARGLGAGKGLIRGLINHAKTLPPILLLQLTVTNGNLAATTLYESLGFQTFGVEPKAIKDGDQFFDKRHMWLALGEK